MDKLRGDLDTLHAQAKECMPQIAAARRAYAKSGSTSDFRKASGLEKQVKMISSKIGIKIKKMQEALGLSDEDFERLLDTPSRGGGDKPDRRPRRELVASKVEVTGFYEDHLPNAIDNVLRLIPRDVRQSLPQDCRLNRVIEGQIPLSLTKGLRPESEFPAMHRLLQSVVVASDYLAQRSDFDHFAGATLVPQLAQLANRTAPLAAVGGDLAERMTALYKGPSAQFDSRL